MNKVFIECDELIYEYKINKQDIIKQLVSPPGYNWPIAPDRNWPTPNQTVTIKCDENFYGGDRMIRSGLINMIRENVRKGKSAYAVVCVKYSWANFSFFHVTRLCQYFRA